MRKHVCRASHRVRHQTAFSDAKGVAGEFVYQCRLLITSANSLDPDQAQQIIGPDQGPNCLTFRWYS